MFTLVELHKMYNSPMLVEDRDTAARYLIHKPAWDSMITFEASHIPHGQEYPPIGARMIYLYGDTPKWKYLGKPNISKTISPEEQKKNNELQRKSSNDSLIRQLKHSKKMNKPVKVKTKNTDNNPGKVLTFPKKGD